VTSLDLRNPVGLGFARTFSLTLSGMRQRLARSAVTLMVMAVAVAFMTNTFGESLIRRRLARVTAAPTAEARTAAAWAARLTRPGSVEQILREIGGAAERGRGLRRSAADGQAR